MWTEWSADLARAVWLPKHTVGEYKIDEHVLYSCDFQTTIKLRLRNRCDVLSAFKQTAGVVLADLWTQETCRNRIPQTVALEDVVILAFLPWQHCSTGFASIESRDLNDRA